MTFYLAVVCFCVRVMFVAQGLFYAKHLIFFYFSRPREISTSETDLV